MQFTNTPVPCSTIQTSFVTVGAIKSTVRMYALPPLFAGAFSSCRPNDDSMVTWQLANTAESTTVHRAVKRKYDVELNPEMYATRSVKNLS